LETKKKKGGVENETLTFFFFFFVSLQTPQTAANNKFSTGIVSIYYCRADKLYIDDPHFCWEKQQQQQMPDAQKFNPLILETTRDRKKVCVLCVSVKQKKKLNYIPLILILITHLHRLLDLMLNKR
jgi:hypothetical protein